MELLDHISIHLSNTRGGLLFNSGLPSYIPVRSVVLKGHAFFISSRRLFIINVALASLHHCEKIPDRNNSREERFISCQVNLGSRESTGTRGQAIAYKACPAMNVFLHQTLFHKDGTASQKRAEAWVQTLQT